MSEVILYLMVIVGLFGAAWYFWQGVKRDKQLAYDTTDSDSYPYIDKYDYSAPALAEEAYAETPVGNPSPKPYQAGGVYVGKSTKRRTDDDDDDTYVAGMAYTAGLVTAGPAQDTDERPFQIPRVEPAYPTEMVQSVRESDSYSLPTPQQASDSLSETLQRSSDVFSSGGHSGWSGGGSGDYGHSHGGSAGGSSGFDSSSSSSYDSGSSSSSSSYDSGSSSSSSDSGSSSSSSSD